ncbi:hypothetical protein EVAR_91588_1 [Eumeta japonica]|uniref:Uncharacterized protein n=1 Tax=Eumeta variegata TaxID=151549 RepID=A0A4C1UXW4_EUMVA|nr:hypothetical protein EVAR_91588_1 [Eumeta japonica]
MKKRSSATGELFATRPQTIKLETSSRKGKGRRAMNNTDKLFKARSNYKLCAARRPRPARPGGRVRALIRFSCGIGRLLLERGLDALAIVIESA